MLKLKTHNKSLFVDLSEYSILAARTSGYYPPFKIEEIAEFSLWGEHTVAGIRAFLGSLGEFREEVTDFVISRCGVHPEGQFIHFFEAEPVGKLKDPTDLNEILKTEFSLDPEENEIAFLNVDDGSHFDLKGPELKKRFICGAPTKELQVVQDRLLEYGLCPERMELSSVATIGGIADYASYDSINSPILCVELNSGSIRVVIQRKGKVEQIHSISFGLNKIESLLQSELGLSDEESGRKLLFSNDLDFIEMRPKLLKHLINVLKTFIGNYEIQTGLAIHHLFVGALPEKLNWVSQAISSSLEIQRMQLCFEPWLENLNIKLADGVEVSNLGNHWMALFSLMGDFSPKEEVASE